MLQDQAGTGRALMAQAVLVRQRDQLPVADDRREPAVGEGEHACRGLRRAAHRFGLAEGVQRVGDDPDGRGGSLRGGLVVPELILAGCTDAIHEK